MWETSDEESTEVSFTEEQELGELEVNVGKRRKLEVIEGITLDVVTGGHEFQIQTKNQNLPA